MAAGGFLLTNFQADFLEHFTPDEDFVYYNDLDDLNHKIQYYLAHDDERSKLRKTGRKKSAVTTVLRIISAKFSTCAAVIHK